MADTKLQLNPRDDDYFHKLKQIYENTKVHSERIYLRKLNPADINSKYVDFYQNEDHVKYMYQSKRNIGAESLKTELETGESTGNFHLYGVFDNLSHECLGNIRVGIITHIHKISDLAIFIGNPKYIGKGYAQEAIRLGNKICFDAYDFRKLHGGMFAENMASVKAYLKTGWVIEGILRAQYFINNEPMDRYCVACFNPKYFSEKFMTLTRTISESFWNEISNPVIGAKP